MIQTVIFDLDGTLLNTLDDLWYSTNAALEQCGFPPRSLEEVRNFVGNGVELLIRRAVPAGTTEDGVQHCLERFRAHYQAHMRAHTLPYPGILELLDRLNRSGCKAAVVSNKFDAAVQELCRQYFGARISVAMGERLGVQKKPAPDLVRACLEALDAEAAGAVYVGDSEVDLQTAQNAGLPCLSVTWGFRSKEFLLAHGARQLIDSPQALGDRLLNG